MDKVKKRQVAKISVFITSLFVIFLSVTYAFINMTLTGTKRQVITAGNLELELEEGNAITLENAMPMDDEVGMIQDAFTFRLVNKVAVSTNYVVKLVDVTTGEKLDTSIVKYGLVKNENHTIHFLSDLFTELESTPAADELIETTEKKSKLILDSGVIRGKEAIEYSLRFWIDSYVEDEILINGKTLSYKLEVEGTLSSGFDTSEIDKKLVHQELHYQDGLETLQNPDRGWYRAIPLQMGDTTYDMQSQCVETKNQKISIIHLRVNIGQFSGNVNADGIDKDFTSNEINSLNAMMNIIRSNGLSVIVRFAYDYDGNTGKEPKSFDTIKNHIQQLAPFFEANKDIISTVEAGFLGPWGEMHTAGQYQSDGYYKDLIETLLKNTPSEMTVNVRKPYFYKLVVGELNHDNHRLGIFNDGYFGSLTDLGTFDNTISRNIFVTWMQKQGMYTLYGGEAVKSGETKDEKYNDSDFVLAEMPKTHTAYLNSQHNLDVINKWKTQSYTSANSEYDSQTAHKYITDHLGYRLVVRDSEISSSVAKGDICGVKLELENVGFGNIVRTQQVSVILRRNRDYYETTLNVNIHNIRGGSTQDIWFYFYIPSDIEAGDWQVYLKVANKESSNYAIQFANSNMWDHELLANCIGKVTIEDSVVEEGVKIKQAFSETATEGNKEQIPLLKIPVTINFNIENGQSYYVVEKYNFELGTTINFKDESALSSLGIKIPEGYTFLYAQCFAITNDWNGHDSITIPAETSETAYEFHVYIKKEG